LTLSLIVNKLSNRNEFNLLINGLFCYIRHYRLMITILFLVLPRFLFQLNNILLFYHFYFISSPLIAYLKLETNHILSIHVSLHRITVYFLFGLLFALLKIHNVFGK
jgi:hypothetical protein